MLSCVIRSILRMEFDKKVKNANVLARGHIRTTKRGIRRNVGEGGLKIKMIREEIKPCV